MCRHSLPPYAGHSGREHDHRQQQQFVGYYIYFVTSTVLLLLPVIVFAAGVTRVRGEGAGGTRPPLLPGFAVAFVCLVALNSAGILPTTSVALGNDVSRWCLVAAVAAIGMKTSLRDLSAVGLKPVMLMLGETLFLAVLVLVMMHWTW